MLGERWSHYCVETETPHRKDHGPLLLIGLVLENVQAILRVAGTKVPS